VLDERGKSYCDQILKASVHVAALVGQINVYIATKDSPLKIEKINLKEILQIVRDEVSPRLAVRQIRWLEPESITEVKADRLSILRVFRNLADNALKYGGEDLSEIRIGYEESEDFHTLTVSDDGAGIREGDQEKIFAAFRRGDTYEAVEGVGLGLAIVTEIAERHGGIVWTEPREDKWTTFYISIPKHL
jgi:light-regulated signal transduction histidine kinase (bacteriophytochrome)